MKIMKAAFRDIDETWITSDAIEYQGKTWLVGRWLENKGLGIAKPERIVRVDSSQYSSDVPSGLSYPVDLIVLIPVPRFVFDLRTSLPLQVPYVAIDRPDITVELSNALTSLH